MSRLKYPFDLHTVISEDAARAVERAAAELDESVSAIARRALNHELRRLGYLPPARMGVPTVETAA